MDSSLDGRGTGHGHVRRCCCTILLSNISTLVNLKAVSNLPFTSKVMEKLAAKRVISHLQDNSFQEELQSAYRAKHRTETALMKIHNDITRGLDGSSSSSKSLLYVTFRHKRSFK